MPAQASAVGASPGWWGVLSLFLIPIGGGIPAGVLLARSRGIAWPVMMLLYFVSDVILAFVYEPLMHLLMALGRRVAFIARVGEAMSQSMRQTASFYGSGGGPFTLVMIAFGIDPMTGRTAAAAAGHGFVSGWAIAIAGDMMYFTVLMVSTLWLDSVVGDGSVTTAIILAAMFGVPWLVRKWREAKPAV